MILIDEFRLMEWVESPPTMCFNNQGGLHIGGIPTTKSIASHHTISASKLSNRSKECLVSKEPRVEMLLVSNFLCLQIHLSSDNTQNHGSKLKIQFSLFKNLKIKTKNRFIRFTFL